MYQALFFSVILLLSSADARKIKVGSPPRGVSAARAGSAAGSQPFGNAPRGGGFNQGGGFVPHQGVPPHQPSGFHPNQPGGFRPNQPSGFHPPNQGFGRSGFGTGTGPGSISRGSQFKTALAAGALGAVGGIVTYELGKAIIHSATQPFHVNNRPYYFDEQNYQQKNGYSMCSMPLDELIKQTQSSTTAAPVETTGGTSNETGATATPSPDQLLSNIQFKDGSRPKTIVWGCKSGSEVCCGTECCPAPSQISNGGDRVDHSRGSSFAGIAFGVLVAILLLICCCCCLAYKFFRSAFDICLPTSAHSNDPNVTYTNDKYVANPPSYDGYSQQQQGYPMQQAYPDAQQGVGYPASQGYTYPSQPPAFQQYPTQPSYPPHNY